MPPIEFATARRGLTAYASLAERSGKPMSTVVALAEENRLHELFDEHGFVGKPRTPQEALRRLDQMRRPPGEKPKTPSELVGELRARKLIWEAEAAEANRRDPKQRLAELYAQRRQWGQ
jgi:hypothetical protein